MEHILQIAIGVDDEAIKERVAESAEKQITKNIEQMVKNKLFEGCYGRNADERSALSEYSKRLLDDFLERHKDEILEKAAVYLAEKLARSKAGKSLMQGGE